MPGAFTGRVLAEGQLPNALGDLYTVPAATIAYIRFMSFFNTNAAAQTVRLDLDTAGTPRQHWRAALAINERAECDSSIVLQAGDIIRGVTTTAAAVNYCITGVEEV